MPLIATYATRAAEPTDLGAYELPIESSLGSGGKSGVLGELVERSPVFVGGGTQRGGLGWVGVGEHGDPGLQQPGVDVGQQHRVVQPGVGDLVAGAPAICAGWGEAPLGLWHLSRVLGTPMTLVVYSWGSWLARCGVPVLDLAFCVITLRLACVLSSCPRVGRRLEFVLSVVAQR